MPCNSVCSQEWVYYGKIKDGKHVLTQILDITGSVTRWNPDITSAENPKVGHHNLGM